MLCGMGDIERLSLFCASYDQRTLAELLNTTYAKHEHKTILHSVFEYNTDIKTVVAITELLQKYGFVIKRDAKLNYPWNQTGYKYTALNKIRDIPEFYMMYSYFENLIEKVFVS